MNDENVYYYCVPLGHINIEQYFVFAVFTGQCFRGLWLLLFTIAEYFGSIT